MIKNLKKEKEKVANHLYYLEIMQKLIELRSISSLKPEYDKVIANMVKWYKLTQK